MTRRSDYVGKEPERLYVVKNETRFRTFVLESKALNCLMEMLEKNEKARLITYVKLTDED